jgi:hypothetical protein
MTTQGSVASALSTAAFVETMQARDRLVELVAEIHDSGGKITPEQTAEIRRLLLVVDGEVSWVEDALARMPQVRQLEKTTREAEEALARMRPRKVIADERVALYAEIEAVQRRVMPEITKREAELEIRHDQELRVRGSQAALDTAKRAVRDSIARTRTVRPGGINVPTNAFPTLRST